MREPVFYPVWVATGGHKVIRRGPDVATPGKATSIIKEKLAKGYASLGVVVEVEGDGSRRVLETYIFPPAAQKVVRHYEDILDSLEEPQEAPEGRGKNGNLYD